MRGYSIVEPVVLGIGMNCLTPFMIIELKPKKEIAYCVNFKSPFGHGISICKITEIHMFKNGMGLALLLSDIIGNRQLGYLGKKCTR